MQTHIIYRFNDILYLGQRLNRDLSALSKAYPDKFPMKQAIDLFNSYTIFLASNTVSKLGFRICDPIDPNLIYYDCRYQLQIDPHAHLDDKHIPGDKPLTKIELSASVIITSWITWSDHVKNLSVRQQEQIVKETGWNISGQNRSLQIMMTEIEQCSLFPQEK